MHLQYIGARYVPVWYENSLDDSANWESNVTYEPLTWVTSDNGHIYLSKKTVPASIGTPADNAEYWLDMGYFDGPTYNQIQTQIDAITESLDNHMLYWKTPEMYGAKGDGVTDDSGAIQAMFDDAEPYDTFLFGAPIYICNAPVETIASAHDIKIVGGFDKSEYSTKIKTHMTGGTLLTINNSGIGIQNICFEGDGKTNNVTLLDFDADNTTLNGNIDAIINMCAFFNSRNGITTKGRNVNISNCVLSTLDIGITYNETSDINTALRGYHVSNNRFHDVNTCINNRINITEGQRNVFITNNFADFSAQLYVGYGAGVFISGNMIDAIGSGMSNNARLIDIVAPTNYSDVAQRTVIANNKLIGWGSRTVAGVMIESYNSVEVIVQNNTIHNCDGFGVGIQADSNAVIVGNTITNCGMVSGYYAINPVNASTCLGLVANNNIIDCNNTIRSSAMTLQNNNIYT